MPQAPTTPRSRRETWRTDVAETVREFQDHAAGRVRESFPPWRIGYMRGLADVREEGSRFLARVHRVRPHGPGQDVAIPHVGAPTPHDVDLLGWHFDQDVRAWDEDDGLGGRRMPLGPLLVDPLTALLLGRAGVDDLTLRMRIEDAEGFGERQRLAIRIGGDVPRAEVTVRMNEVRATYEIPGTRARWTAGALAIRLDAAPETLAASARGMALAEVVDHPMVRDAAGIRITSMTPRGGDAWTIHTDAAHPDGMVAVPPRQETAR